MTEKETVEVIIDANEASQKPELVQKLAMHEDVVDYEIQPLDEGDIVVDNCIFERKTPSDFASSLEEGRLREQVERMAGHEETPYVLVEGDMGGFDELEHTNIGSKSLRGMDASIEMKNNIRVKYCSNLKNVVDMAVRLARKEKEDVKTRQAKQTDAIKDVSFIEQVFLAIDGVGIKTSEKLAEEFQSLEEIYEATTEDFQSVEDVGEVTAQNITTEVKNGQERTEKETEKESRTYTI
jgi:Fanconi anemia group M protein